MITHLLFDHDGVLVDTENWYFEATSQALARLGVTMQFDDYKQHLIDGQSSWVEAIRRGISQTEIDVARAWRDERYQHYLRTEDIDIAGVADVLEELSQTFKMAVITTAKRADFELIHSKRTLLDRMTFVLCREDYDKAKPDAEPYQTGLIRFEIEPNSAIVIEDSKRGLVAAEAAGIRTVKVYNEFVAYQDAFSDYAIQSLEELPHLLLNISRLE